jgi:subtilisin family serine protease
VATTSSLQIMEPERYVYAIADDLAYIRGFRDAINHVYEELAARSEGSDGPAAQAVDESRLSWGLQATNVGNSSLTGQGIKIAILDTGLDLNHPDFAGRNITAKSFIDGAVVQDGNGHGTHCVGVAAGPRRPQQLPRYGVAYEADIYVGKVLNDAGRGVDANIIAGIQWARSQSCTAISMSLGAPVSAGQSFSRIFQQIADRCLASGSLIIAAAGNESNRSRGQIAPVGHPANCPGIMSVAAVDRRFATAWFSNAGLNPAGGKIDVAGPGVDVLSAWPRPTLYRSENGTSMATPHVAGIAALIAQAHPDSRGRDLWSRITQRSRPLSADSRDVGAGLVQAP